MIVKCKECGKDVSTEAVACPACGCPQKFEKELPPKAIKQKQSHIFGWIALIAFFMANYIPAIIAPLIILIAIIFSLLEVKQGGKVFGGIVFSLCLLQVWAIADHFGGLSASIGLTNTKQIEKKMVKKYENTNINLPADAALIIEQKCAEEWPNDFKMRNYCQKQQQEGISILDRGMPNGIQPDAFRIIRGKCASEWPRDFKMRAYCESQQYEAYRALQMNNKTSSAVCAQQWPDDYKMRQYCESKK
jgi:hypothetical protein